MLLSEGCMSIWFWAASEKVEQGDEGLQPVEEATVSAVWWKFKITVELFLWLNQFSYLVIQKRFLLGSRLFREEICYLGRCPVQGKPVVLRWGSGQWLVGIWSPLHHEQSDLRIEANFSANEVLLRCSEKVILFERNLRPIWEESTPRKALSNPGTGTLQIAILFGKGE